MSCSVSFSLFPPSTVRRSILLLPSAFDQPSTIFLSFIQTRVSCLSSFLFPRLFVSLFCISRGLYSAFMIRLFLTAFALFVSSLSLLLYLPLFIATVFRLFGCTYVLDLLQQSNILAWCRNGSSAIFAVLFVSVFRYSPWRIDTQTLRYSIIDIVRWTIGRNKPELCIFQFREINCDLKN